MPYNIGFYEEKDEIESVNSNKFETIINDVERLHQHVVRPREQVADAEVLLDLTSTLFDSAKANSTGNVTPAELVSSLLRQYCKRGKSENVAKLFRWKAIGRAAAPVFKKARGCLTMIGPMELKIKQRKAAARRRRNWLKPRCQPKEVNSTSEVQTDTEKNIHMMFKILKEKSTVKLENLILNRHSFAQTVENLFALSFLVRDGRVLVQVDDNGSHFVSPRNAPDTKLVVSGEVEYGQFGLRLDFPDWKLMKNLVPEGEELMPHRDYTSNADTSKAFIYSKEFTHNPDIYEDDEFDSKDFLVPSNTMPAMLDNLGVSEEEYEFKVFEMPSNTTPITALSERFMAKDMPKTGGATTANPRCKRKLFCWI